MKTKKKEIRNYDLNNFIVREENGKTIIEGYASVFNKESLDLGGFIEVVRTGAFKKTLQENKEIRALWNHNSDFPLASVKSKTLELKEDKNGLFIRINPAEPLTTTASDLIKNLNSGVVDKMSFGFNVIKDSWTDDRENDTVMRELLEVELFEVSPLGGWPAYPDTQIGLRGLAEAGIDKDRINAILIKRNHCINITEDEKNILKKYSEIIRSYIEEPHSEEPHSSESIEPRKDLTLRIRRASIKTQSYLRRK